MQQNRWWKLVLQKLADKIITDIHPPQVVSVGLPFLIAELEENESLVGTLSATLNQNLNKHYWAPSIGNYSHRLHRNYWGIEPPSYLFSRKLLQPYFGYAPKELPLLLAPPTQWTGDFWSNYQSADSNLLKPIDLPIRFQQSRRIRPLTACHSREERMIGYP